MNKYKNKQVGGTNYVNEIFNVILSNIWFMSILLISILIGIYFIVLKINPLNIKNKYPIFSKGFLIISTLFIISIFIFSYIFGHDSKNIIDFESKIVNKEFQHYLYTFLFLLLSIIVPLLIIYYIYNSLSKGANYNNMIKTIFIIIVIIFSITIGYLIYKEITTFKPTQKKPEEITIWDILLKIILFIPCLLIDLINYLRNQFEITTKPVWILLIIEIFIILLYFLFPLISKFISTHEGKLLLEGPVYTNNLVNLGSFQNLKQSNNYNYNYGIACSIYINPQPPSTNFSYNQYTSLFNYANKPNILYNAKKNTLKIICQNKKNDLVTIYQSDNINYQKWMNFVINFNSGILDVFLDNKLVASQSNIMPYMNVDKVTGGSSNGINGGLKNVIYFSKPIKSLQQFFLF